MQLVKRLYINFTPHLVPMNRGILVNRVCNTLNRKADGSLPTYEEVKAAYDKYYANEKFVRVLEKDVVPADKMGRGQQLCGC